MKIAPLILALFLCLSCSNKKQNPTQMGLQPNEKISATAALQVLFDSANIKGSVLIYDYELDSFYSNDLEWANKGHLPASTFKIANSIIAFETGTIHNDSTIIKWDGGPRTFKIWEQDLVFKDAFQLSCVPCFQEIARAIGSEKMNLYLNKIEYANMDVNPANISQFWLQGQSRISQLEQVNFLSRFYHSELQISQRTQSFVKRLLKMEDNGDYKLSGKTGWSVQNGKDNGWFVGYVETKGKVYFFATNLEPNEGFNMDNFALIRKDITLDSFRRLKIIE